MGLKIKNNLLEEKSGLRAVLFYRIEVQEVKNWYSRLGKKKSLNKFQILLRADLRTVLKYRIFRDLLKITSSAC